MNHTPGSESHVLPPPDFATEKPNPPKKAPELRRDQQALDVILGTRPVLRINSVRRPQIQLPLTSPGVVSSGSSGDGAKFHELSHSRVRAEIAYLVQRETGLILRDQEITRLLNILEGMAWESPIVESELERVLDESPLIEAVYLFLKQQENLGEFHSSGTRLLEELQKIGNRKGVDLKSKDWPRSASSLSRRLGELKDPLQKIGIEVDVGRKGGGERYVSLKMIQNEQKSSSCDDSVKLPSQESHNNNTTGGRRLGECDECSDEQKMRIQRLMSKSK